jgi:hypothetical protein
VRLLVAGSRDWTDSDTIIDAVRDAVRFNRTGDHILVHGACPTGADMIAHLYARRSTGMWPETHPARWNLYGAAAGPIRNQAMADLGADLALIFIRNGSRGATDMWEKAQYAGIPTAVYRMED